LRARPIDVLVGILNLGVDVARVRVRCKWWARPRRVAADMRGGDDALVESMVGSSSDAPDLQGGA